MLGIDRTKDWLYYALVAIVWIAYAYINITNPISPAMRQFFGLTNLGIAAVRATTSLLYLVIWLVGVYSILAIRNYANLSAAKGSPEAINFSKLKQGLRFLLAGIIIPSILIALRSFYASTGDSLVAPLTIISNYLFIFFPLAGFILIFQGAKLKDGKIQTFSETDDILIAIIFTIVISSIYIPLVFTNPIRTLSQNPLTPPTYFLSDLIIFITIVIPIAITWLLGVFTSLRIFHFSPEISGLPERKAREFLGNGLLFIIFASILSQILNSIGGDRLILLGAGLLTATIYILISLQLAGFSFIAAGANKLLVAQDKKGEAS